MNVLVLVTVSALIGGVIFYLNKTPRVENGTETGNGKVKLNLVAGPVVGSVKSETLGEYLTDTKGMTLYVFADDEKLKSVCMDACLEKWPPLMYDNKDVASLSDTLSKRMNVIKQTDDRWATYAYGEKPLYYYVGDKYPGEVNGNGLDNGKWSIVLIAE